MDNRWDRLREGVTDLQVWLKDNPNPVTMIYAEDVMALVQAYSSEILLTKTKVCDETWGVGNWITCDVCPKDKSGNAVAHHKGMHTQDNLVPAVPRRDIHIEKDKLQKAIYDALYTSAPTITRIFRRGHLNDQARLMVNIVNFQENWKPQNG